MARDALDDDLAAGEARRDGQPLTVGPDVVLDEVNAPLDLLILIEHVETLAVPERSRGGGASSETSAANRKVSRLGEGRNVATKGSNAPLLHLLGVLRVEPALRVEPEDAPQPARDDARMNLAQLNLGDDGVKVAGLRRGEHQAAAVSDRFTSLRRARQGSSHRLGKRMLAVRRSRSRAHIVCVSQLTLCRGRRPPFRRVERRPDHRRRQGFCCHSKTSAFLEVGIERHDDETYWMRWKTLYSSWRLPAIQSRFSRSTAVPVLQTKGDAGSATAGK